MGLPIAVAIGAAAVYLLRPPGDETRLWRSFDRLLRAVEKQHGEHLLDAAARSREIAEVFAPEVRIILPPFGEGLVSKNELISRIFQFRAMVDALEIHTRDRALSIAPDRRTAVMRMGASAEARSADAVEREFRNVTIRWERVESAWRIAAVTAEEGFRRLPPP